MKKILTILIVCLFVLSLGGAALATNGYQLIGVGQLQKSMGGAVTANPMGAMCIISNPASVARIGSRADFSMEAFIPTRSVNFENLGGESTEGGSKLYGIPSIGWAAPAFNRDNLYFGGGMFATSGMGVDYGQNVFMPGAALDMMSGAPSGTFKDVTFDGFSVIQFWKMAPTIGWNVNDQLSLGFSLNLDYQSLTFRQRLNNVPFWNNPSDPMQGITQMNINFDLGRPTSQMGIGAAIGALYDVNDMLTIGATYTSQQNFGDAEFRVGEGDIYNYAGAMGLAGIYKMDMQFPQQFAMGIAVKPTDKLLVSADIKWINWSSTHDNIKFSGPDGAFDTDGNPMNGGEADSIELAFGWEDQWVYALGVQYGINDRLNLRTGYNYAKSPIDEADVFNNLIFPAIVEHHFAIGFDYMLGDHWGIGMTYMKAFKNTLEGKGDVSEAMQQVTPFTADSGAEISLEEDSIGIQLTYLF